jgi:hypothetical protein
MLKRIAIVAGGFLVAAVGAAAAQTAIRAPDVAYQPGVDVRGRPVVGADLNPAPQFGVPDTVAFDIAVDLKKYGIASASPLFQPNFKLGDVRMDVASGRVLYNGQPLGNPELEALRDACRAQGLAKP